MARITVEDCIKKVNNRFELVVLAAARTREIWKGNPLLVERDNDKPPIIALREIADTQVDFGNLKEHLITGLQRVTLREELSDKEVRETLAEEVARGVRNDDELKQLNSEGEETAKQNIFEDVDISRLDT